MLESNAIPDDPDIIFEQGCLQFVSKYAVENYLLPVQQNIIPATKEILNQMQGKVDIVFMVGGFSTCKQFFDAVQI